MRNALSAALVVVLHVAGAGAQAVPPKGASVTADTAVLVEGDQDFRPVAIAAEPGGAIYFTDWVKRDSGKDIAAYGASKHSLMPDGLEAGLSVGDMRELVAYLESLR